MTIHCPTCGGSNLHEWTHNGRSIRGCACELEKVLALFSIPIIRKVTVEDEEFLKACGTSIE